MRVVLIAALLSFASTAFAQQQHHQVDMRNTYRRIYVVLPMIPGKGTAADPRRPMFAPPPPAPGTAPSRSGIIAFHYQLSDDKQFALVEFVAQNRAAFAPILTSNLPNLIVFEKGKHKKEDIEKELRKYKKDFDIRQLGVNVR